MNAPANYKNPAGKGTSTITAMRRRNKQTNNTFQAEFKCLTERAEF